MRKVFISYRREDSAGAYVAQSIQGELDAHFGKGSAVFDVDSIPLGKDYRLHLDEEVQQCDVLLAVIGDHWLRLLHERRDDPRDFVQIEITAALKRDIPVVPVLVGNASMPKEGDLAEDLAPLAFRQATEVRAGKNLSDHFEHLLRGLDKLFDTEVKTPIPPTKAKTQRKSKVTKPKPPLYQAVDIVKDKLKVGGKGPAMVIIAKGTFTMGSPLSEQGRYDDEGPQHRVSIAKAFALGQCPVIFADYDRFARTTARDLPDDEGWGRDQRPVINVSWHDAQAYSDWMSAQTGFNYRLPSEAEWEYAARASTTAPFYCGETIHTDQANYNGETIYSSGQKGKYLKKTVSVGSYPANPFQLYDMHGNVWEWLQDGYQDNYDGAPAEGSAWQAGVCASRVLRGGSWLDVPLCVRSANRGRIRPDDRYDFVGFRLARML
ncbi:MAG: SUMF1/EgtB/PvdO family nonheme iron enzyme [Thiohalomonadales bacterium]